MTVIKWFESSKKQQQSDIPCEKLKPQMLQCSKNRWAMIMMFRTKEDFEIN